MRGGLRDASVPDAAVADAAPPPDAAPPVVYSEPEASTEISAVA